MLTRHHRLHTITIDPIIIDVMLSRDPVELILRKSLYVLQELSAGKSQRKVIRRVYWQEAQDVLAKGFR
jgi:hypothetical protein